MYQPCSGIDLHRVTCYKLSSYFIRIWTLYFFWCFVKWKEQHTLFASRMIQTVTQNHNTRSCRAGLTISDITDMCVQKEAKTNSYSTQAHNVEYKTHKSKLTSTFTQNYVDFSSFLYDCVSIIYYKNCGLLCTTIPNDYNKFIIFELIVLNWKWRGKKEFFQNIKISLKCMKNRNSIVNYEIRDDDWWVNGITPFQQIQKKLNQLAALYI